MLTEVFVFKSKKGLNPEVIKEICFQKGEPEWMLAFRLRAYEIFLSKAQPIWGANLKTINYDDIYYYLKPTEKMATSWKDLPKDILDTYKKL